MVQFIRSDLEFILAQITIAEQHAAGDDLRALLPNSEVAFGLRTVDGSLNNLVPGQSEFGAADTIFPRLTDPVFRTAESGTSYAQASGLVFELPAAHHLQSDRRSDRQQSGSLRNRL